MNEVKKLLLFLLALILIVFVYRIVSSPHRPETPSSARIPTVNAWPPFTMYYREEGQVRVINWGLGMQRYKFVFNNAHDWTHTIIDSTHKEFVGSYKRYTGETFVQFEASSNSTSTADTSKDELYIPDQWLSFGYIKGMQQMPNVSISKTDDPALGKWIETGEIICDETDPNLTNCKPGQKVRKGSREITYRLDTLIPVLMVDKVDGKAIYTATVEKLEFR